MKRTPMPARTTPLPKVSRRRALARPARRKVAAQLLAEYPLCQLGDAFKANLPGHVCFGVADAPHELRKRSGGGSVLNRRNLLAACFACNVAVEDHPALAHRLGFVVRPGDSLWDELGRDG